MCSITPTEASATIAAGPTHAGLDSAAEPGVIVIWPRARPFQDRVLELASERLRVVDVTDLWWTPDRALENYNRFYRARAVPPYRTSILHDKGQGPALVVTVIDPQPHYAARRTTGGDKVVSTTAFDIKAGVRAEAPGGPSVHSSDNPAEARRDLMMLLGRDLPDPRAVTTWDGTIASERRDVIGADGWETVDDLFRALDAAGPYVVLRNYEQLPESLSVKGHDDIDILTSSYRDIVAMARARPLVGVLPRCGGRFHVDIGGRAVLCDIRLVGDGYYPTRWQEELLATRRRYRDLTWVPSAREYHESLLYHGLIHKPAFSDEYRRRLDDMAARLGEADLLLGDDAARPGQVLADILTRRGFAVTEPKDPTVFFNHRQAGSRAPQLMRVADAVHRRLYRAFMRFSRRPTTYAVRAVRERVVTGLPAIRSLGRMARATLLRRRAS